LKLRISQLLRSAELSKSELRHAHQSLLLEKLGIHLSLPELLLSHQQSLLELLLLLKLRISQLLRSAELSKSELRHAHQALLLEKLGIHLSLSELLLSHQQSLLELLLLDKQRINLGSELLRILLQKLRRQRLRIDCSLQLGPLNQI